MGLDNLIDVVRRGSSSEIIAALFELELGGLVRQLPGKSYIRFGRTDEPLTSLS